MEVRARVRFGFEFGLRLGLRLGTGSGLGVRRQRQRTSDELLLARARQQDATLLGKLRVVCQQEAADTLAVQCGDGGTARAEHLLHLKGSQEESRRSQEGIKEESRRNQEGIKEESRRNQEGRDQKKRSERIR